MDEFTIPRTPICVELFGMWLSDLGQRCYARKYGLWLLSASHGGPRWQFTVEPDPESYGRGVPACSPSRDPVARLEVELLPLTRDYARLTIRWHPSAREDFEILLREVQAAFPETHACIRRYLAPAAAFHAPEDTDRAAPVPQSLTPLRLGKAGRRRDECYDDAHGKLAGGRQLDQVFAEFCEQAGLTRPDKSCRDAFKAAMRRRNSVEMRQNET